MTPPSGKNSLKVVAIIHLAAISNDPSADLDVDLTDEINCRATEHLALAAKKR